MSERREWWIGFGLGPTCAHKSLETCLECSKTQDHVHVREVLPPHEPETMQDIRVEVNGELRGRYANIEVMKFHIASMIEELDDVRQQHARLVEAAEAAVRISKQVPGDRFDQNVQRKNLIEAVWKIDIALNGD